MSIADWDYWGVRIQVPGRAMPDQPTWNVVLVRPGEDQLALLADLSARRNVRIVAIFDPEGTSVGASLAPVLGLRVISDLEELEPGEALYLVHPQRDELNSPVVDQARDYGLLGTDILGSGFNDRVSMPCPLPQSR